MRGWNLPLMESSLGVLDWAYTFTRSEEGYNTTDESEITWFSFQKDNCILTMIFLKGL